MSTEHDQPSHHPGEHQRGDGRRGDPRQRPADPAGTRPKVDPDSLKPSPHPGQLALRPGAGDGAVAVPAAAAPPARASAAGPSPADDGRHMPRFQFLLGALTAIGITAVVLTIALLAGPPPPRHPPWSAWRPVSGAGDPAEQIALHVAPQYRLANGHELVEVTGGPQAVGGQPVVVAVRSSGSEPSALPNDGVFYQLCGAGPHCSIPGKASVQRALLVKREALELALYTFHYLSQSSQVVVTFPPPPPGTVTKTTAQGKTVSVAASAKQTPSHVLLFRPSDLASELARPLEETLPAKAPSVATVESSPEAPLVSRLTTNATYDSTLTQQESTLVMLLQAPSLGG